MALERRTLDVGSVLRNALALRQLQQNERSLRGAAETRRLQNQGLEQQNALIAARQKFAPGAIAGDPEALQGLAGTDPTTAIQIQNFLAKAPAAARAKAVENATSILGISNFIEGSQDPAAAYRQALPQLQQFMPGAPLPEAFDPGVLGAIRAEAAPFVDVSRENKITNVPGVGAVSIDPLTQRTETLVAARALPKPFEPKSDVGEAIFDQAEINKVFGADSPQGRAIAEAVRDEQKGGKPKLTDVAGLRKEYTKQSQPFIDSRAAFDKIEGASDTAAGDLALMFGFMKALDPTSVVRESEFATVAQTGSLGQRLQANVSRVLSGERLTPAQRADFKNEALQSVVAQLPAQERLRRSFSDIAARQNMNPENVTPDFAAGLNAQGSQAQAPTPAAPAVPARTRSSVAAPAAAQAQGADDGGAPAAQQPEGTIAVDGQGNSMIVQGGVWVPM